MIARPAAPQSAPSAPASYNATRPRRRRLAPLGLVGLLAAAAGPAGCAGSSAGDSAPEGGGGNVGFGGAQDFGQFRDILSRGEVPGPNTLDANGFFSEHYTELPEPDCGQPLCLQTMVSVKEDWVDGAYQATLQVALNTPRDPADMERKPLNLAVVVDTSGSMALDDRIGYVRTGLRHLVDELHEGDRLAVITYANESVIRLPLTGVEESQNMRDVIDNLGAAGSTNIYDGLRMGFEVIGDSFDTERQNRVILLSDGLATAGITEGWQIIEMSEYYLADGIGLTTIGVGNDFNVDLMRGLAERGSGNFYYLEDANAIAEVFTEEIDFFVSPLALAVEIEVAAAASYELGEVTGTRLWQTGGSFGSMFVPAVFLASRTSEEPGPTGRRGGGSSLFIELKPRSGVFEDPQLAAEVRLSYSLPESGERIESSVKVDNPHRDQVPEGGWISHEFMEQNHAVYNMFRGFWRAADEARWDYTCAHETLVRLESNARAWNQDYRDPDIAADLELSAQFRANLVRAGAEPGGVCDGPPDGFDDDYYGEYDDDYYGPRACSTTGTGGGAISLLLLMGALALSRRRSR